MITVYATHLSTLRSKSLGLIRSPTPRAVYFKTRWGIHTFGVKFPIGVIVLDDTLTVKRLHKKLLPNSLFFWPIFYQHILELPIGFIENNAVQIGDTIEIISTKK